jgi:PAS domain S-box-containing protein
LNTELRAEISGYTAELKAAIESLKVGERYLKEREEQFHATFELAGVGIAHVSPEGRWLRVNGKLSEILGYERKELLARTFQDITYPEDLGTDLIHVERLLAGDIATYSSEKRYIKKDSTVVWASLTVSLVRGVGGEPKYFISVIEDITRRKRAEALLKSLTPGEIDVLGEMVRGRTNSEIAEELAFSVDTIKARVKSVIEKLGVADRTQAAVSAAETGLFDGSVNETVGESPHASRNGATG